MSQPDNLSLVLVSPETTIREAMERMNVNARGIVLVVDGERRLLATVTDGDLRRAILATGNLSMRIQEVLERQEIQPGIAPIVASPQTPAAELLQAMRRHSVRHIPLLDADQRVVGLARLEDLVDEAPALRAVVMAGGYGTRLRPLTDETPKPLLPVGDRPLIEHIVAQLRESGVQHVSVTTHYRSGAIKEHLGNGRQFGVEIDYVTENSPLGTAGALALLPPWESTLLVINGDILTRLNYRTMLDFHREHGAALTVGVRHYEVQVPYGVIESDGAAVRAVNEKPTLRFFVNAGVYLLEPEIHAQVHGHGRLDMTDVIRNLIAAGRPVANFPISEYWLDIGHLPDYERANADIASGTY